MFGIPTLRELSSKLDKTLHELNTKGQVLKNDPSFFRRLVWRFFFRDPDVLHFEEVSSHKLPPQYPLPPPLQAVFDLPVRGSSSSVIDFHRLIFNISFVEDPALEFDSLAPTLPNAAHAASKIIHVTNLLDPELIENPSLRSRLKLALLSVERANRKNVTLLGASAGGHSLPCWRPYLLSRSAASELDSTKDFAFIKDLFDAACSIAGDDDLLFYSNLDCPLSPDIYNKLLEANQNVTEFFRQEVEGFSQYPDFLDAPTTLYEIGIDGLCLRKSTYLQIRDRLPDSVIGEPHWDTAFSGVLHKHYEVSQNVDDLYHPKHPQEWDDNNLSVAGAHNKNLYLDCVNYGLMDDVLISPANQTVIVLLKPTLDSSDPTRLHSLIGEATLFSSRCEVVFCELTDENSPFMKSLTGIKYLPIFHSNEYTEALCQDNSIINCLMHRFCHFKNIIIIKESFEGILSHLIKQLQAHLQTHPFLQSTDFIALKNSHILQNELDIYGRNDILFSDPIEDISFMNDDGLLELLNNHAA